MYLPAPFCIVIVIPVCASSQLRQAEEAHQAETTDLNALTEEFTTRISEAEKRCQAAIKEKDKLKKQLQQQSQSVNK